MQAAADGALEIGVFHDGHRRLGVSKRRRITDPHQRQVLRQRVLGQVRQFAAKKIPAVFAHIKLRVLPVLAEGHANVCL